MTEPHHFRSITGNLRDYAQFQPDTFLHADKLTTQRCIDPHTPDGNLREQSFYTADSIIYLMCEGIPALAILRGENNVALRHLDDAFAQLTKDKNYRPDPQEIQTALQSPEALFVDLSQLNLHHPEPEWNYLSVKTSDYGGLNLQERELAERVYGQGADFSRNMQVFKEASVTESRIYVLSPDYVREHAEQGPIVRVSWLHKFNNGSNFFANDRLVQNFCLLRGVLWIEQA